MFTTDFAKYVCPGDEITCTVDGFTVTARCIYDDTVRSPEEEDEGFWPSLDPDSNSYIGPKSKSTLARHMRQALEVIRAWKNDEWFYCGIRLSVSMQNVVLCEHAASL